MGIKVFNKIELNLLEMNGGLTRTEIQALEKGMNVSLSLVIKAKRLLEDYRKQGGVVEDGATRAELNLLIAEIQQVAEKQFLIFKVLEKKKLISMKEMLEMAESFDAPKAKPKKIKKSK